MANGPMNGVIRHLRRCANLGDAAEPTDGAYSLESAIELDFNALLKEQGEEEVALDEMKARIAQQGAHAFRLQVHAEDMPIGVSENVLAQVMTDEAIDAKNQNVFHMNL